MAANCQSLLNAYDLKQERPLNLSTHPEIAEELFKPGFRRMKTIRVEKRRNRNQRDVEKFNEVSAATKTKR